MPDHVAQGNTYPFPSPSLGEILLRTKQVLPKVGVSRAHLYDLIRRGEFPAPIKLGARTAVWPLSVVEAWITDRIQAARAA